MKASEFITQLQSAIDKHGDLDLVVGYDSSQAEIDAGFDDSFEAWSRCSDGLWPRSLILNDEPGRKAVFQI